MHLGHEQPGTRRHADSLLALNRVMAERVRVRAGERVLDALESAAGWTAALVEAGFDDVEVEDITPRMTRSLRRLERLCRALDPIARVLYRLRVRTDAQQRNIAGSLAMWRALQQGEWRYGLVNARRPPAAG